MRNYNRIFSVMVIAALLVTLLTVGCTIKSEPSIVSIDSEDDTPAPVIENDNDIADDNLSDVEVTKRFVGFNGILTYENDGYNGSETGCDYKVLDIGEETDAEMLEYLENMEKIRLPSRIVGNDATPLARMYFDVGYIPDSISVRAHGPDSPDGEFDILLTTEVFDEKSWLLTLPANNGQYCLIADCYWSDGMSKAIVFSVVVS